MPGCKCSERVQGSKVSTFGAGVIISVYQVSWLYRLSAVGSTVYSVSMAAGGGGRLDPLVSTCISCVAVSRLLCSVTGSCVPVGRLLVPLGPASSAPAFRGLSC